jgi:hypothetical protein
VWPVKVRATCAGETRAGVGGRGAGPLACPAVNAEAGYRVRYVTAAAPVNELVEAADDKILSRTIARFGLLRATQNQHNSGLGERSTRE